MKAIIGKKVGMSQIFDENGKVIPVTVIEAGPCVVVQKKTAEKDGYDGRSAGLRGCPRAQAHQARDGPPEQGMASAPKKYLREFDLENAAELNIGDVIKADTFKEGDFVDVTGISKGHGYQGVIKRHGAQRTPMSHGGGPVHRHAGSMGSTTDPSRIFKGHDRRRPDGLRAGHHPEPGRGQGRSRAEPDRCPRRHPRPQGRPGADQDAPSRSTASRTSSPASATTRRRLPAVIPRRLPPVTK